MLEVLWTPQALHATRSAQRLRDLREAFLSRHLGALSFEHAKAKALELDSEFQEAFRQTDAAEGPDYHRVDDFLIWARRRMVDA